MSGSDHDRTESNGFIGDNIINVSSNEGTMRTVKKKYDLLGGNT